MHGCTLLATTGYNIRSSKLNSVVLLIPWWVALKM